MHESSTWYSERVRREVTLNRWGHRGQPVLIFPTAGGDAGEIERFHVIRVLKDIIDAGRIKVYSCDSVGGQVWFSKEGTPEHRMWMQHQFHQYIRHEVAPAIRRDCNDTEATIWASGASIGAFHSAAVVCRFPDVFSRALAMSGTFNILRFIETEFKYTQEYFVSSPLQFVPTLKGPHLDKLRERFILFATGEGRAENIGESWALANVLGNQGIPNRVDSWGPEWHHDWPTWRNMLPKYLGEWTE